jgi:hypothetical protein
LKIKLLDLLFSTSYNAHMPQPITERYTGDNSPLEPTERLSLKKLVQENPTSVITGGDNGANQNRITAALDTLATMADMPEATHAHVATYLNGLYENHVLLMTDSIANITGVQTQNTRA